MSHSSRFARSLAAALCAVLTFSLAPLRAEPLAMTGFNLAGAEFGVLPGKAGVDYFYPSQTDVTALLLRGVSIFRLPFRWERLQKTLDGPLDADETMRLSDAVKAITAKGARVIVSPHNYGRYNGKVIGSADLPDASFGAFWRELASLFRDNSLVIFGLMNEPHDMPTEQWRDAANTAIQAIRDAGATNLILVPGNAWTGGQSWTSSDYGTANAVAMRDIRDPLNNYAYEIHQYFDVDFSGTHATCQDGDIGEQSLKGVTDWLARIGKKGFLGEFGATVNPTCLQAMDNMLYYVEDHRDVWMGWTYWAAGSWWGAHPMSAQPRGGVDPPQITTLLSHIQKH